uniref:Putative secreted protein n=1 Tax=Rhipicephalus microplus TaxID=6941 RepID=A0A6M2DBJ8_RHIMP
MSAIPFKTSKASAWLCSFTSAAVALAIPSTTWRNRCSDKRSTSPRGTNAAGCSDASTCCDFLPLVSACSDTAT